MVVAGQNFVLSHHVVVVYSSHIRGLSDSELVEQFKADGNQMLIGELFRRYRHLVYGVCMKYLADEDESQDVQMQVFEKLLTDLHRHEISQFKGWLYAVARNECLMYLRSRKSKRLHEQELQKDLAGFMETETPVHPDGVTEQEWLLRQMENGLQHLNEQQRNCIELFYLQKKSYQQVADQTGYSLTEVKSHIQNGKRNLKILLTKQQHG
jgi:RNA polymerase sigma-70 factor (ECF subfamily)